MYAIAKFARLCSDCNPHLLELLFCREAEVRFCSAAGRALRDAAPLFLSQKVAQTFTGYALSQLKRIQGHRQWLLNPPSAPPTRAQFGLPERTLLPRDQMMAADAEVRRRLDTWSPDWGPLPASEIQRLEDRLAGFMAEVLQAGESKWHLAARAVGLDDNLIAAMDRERRYRSAQRHWSQYRTWQNQRNPARAALEAAHGYDTKHGAHLIRLLRMGLEILETGEVHVWRGGRDAEELRAIRAGAWSYEALCEQATARAARLRILQKQQLGPLPAKPDEEAINALVVDLTRDDLIGARPVEGMTGRESRGTGRLRSDRAVVSECVGMLRGAPGSPQVQWERRNVGGVRARTTRGRVGCSMVAFGCVSAPQPMG